MNHSKLLSLQWMNELAENTDLWSILSEPNPNYPSSILFEYAGIKEVMESQNIYGSLLLLKDIYENVVKIPALMTLIFLDDKSKHSENLPSQFQEKYQSILAYLLDNPLSMGRWKELINSFIKNNSVFQLPESLLKLLQETRKLFLKKCGNCSDIVNWRNQTIGHGKCKLMTDPSYKAEVSDLLKNLSVYFKATEVCYANCYLEQKDRKLSVNTSPLNDTDTIFLFIDGQQYTTGKYLLSLSNGYYFFDSFYSEKKLEKHMDHVAGNIKSTKNGFFQKLFISLNRDILSPISSKFVTDAEDRYLADLNAPTNYIEPYFLIEQIQNAMNQHTKGVILICMERGMGKSALIHQLDGMYYNRELLENATIRCYYCSHGHFRGLHDFVSAFNYAFSTGPGGYHLWESTACITPLSEDSETKSADFANVMHAYYDYYYNQGSDTLVYCLDGIDELTEDTKAILNYIPTADELNDGEFIILTSRLSTEDTMDHTSILNIENAKQKATCTIEITRETEEYKTLLKDYINQTLPASDDSHAILEEVDYRFLYLKVYLELKQLYSQQLLDTSNASTVFASYLNYLGLAYGKKLEKKLKFICAVFSLFKEISVFEIGEYITSEGKNLSTLGCINDLLPLLITTRKKGVNYYKFANVEYESYVLNHYEDACFDVINTFTDNLQDCHLSELLEENLSQEKLLFFVNAMISFTNYASRYPKAKTYLYQPAFLNAVLSLNSHMEKYQNATGYMKYLAKQLLDVALQCFLSCANEDLTMIKNQVPCDELMKISYSSLMTSDDNLNLRISFDKSFDTLKETLREIIYTPGYHLPAWHHLLFPPIKNEAEFSDHNNSTMERMSWYLTSKKGDFLFREFVHVAFNPDHNRKANPGEYLPYFEFWDRERLCQACHSVLSENEINTYCDFISDIKLKMCLHPTSLHLFCVGIAMLQDHNSDIEHNVLNADYETMFLHPINEYMTLVPSLTYETKDDLENCLLHTFYSVQNLPYVTDDTELCTKIENKLNNALQQLHHALWDAILKIISQDDLTIEQKEQQIEQILPTPSYFISMLDAVITPEERYQTFENWYKLLRDYVNWNGKITHQIVYRLLTEISTQKEKAIFVPQEEYSHQLLYFNQAGEFSASEFALFLLLYYKEQNLVAKQNDLLQQLNSCPMSRTLKSKFIYVKNLIGYHSSYKNELTELKENIYSELIQKFENFNLYTDFNEFRDDIYVYMEIFYYTRRDLEWNMISLSSLYPNSKDYPLP